MSRCYACSCLLENPPIDKPTGRYYCHTCFEPTEYEIMRALGLDLEAEHLELNLDPLSPIELEETSRGDGDLIPLSEGSYMKRKIQYDE